MRIALIISLLAAQTPAAPLVLTGIAAGWRADISFWLLSSGWAATATQGGGGHGAGAGERRWPGPAPRPSPRRQERQEERDARVTRIRIHPGDVTLRLDEPVVFAAVAYDQNDAPMGGVRFGWSGQDAGRGNRGMLVSAAGEFKSAVAGRYKVTARGAGKQAHVFVTVLESEEDGDGQTRRTRRTEPPRRVSTRDLPPAQRAAREGRKNRRRQSKSDYRGAAPGAERAGKFVKASFVKSSLAEPPTPKIVPAAAPTAALPPLDEFSWNDDNYMTADDPGAQVGNPPGSPVDDGAGSSNFQMAAPVLGLPGRGVDLSLGLAYNSRVWHKANNDITFDIDRGWPAPGWSLGFGKIVSMGSQGSMMIDADGTRHAYTGQVTSAPNYTQFNGHTTDGTFVSYTHYYYFGGDYEYGWAEAKYPNGTRVEYAAAGQGAVYPVRITDASGNDIRVAYRNNSGPQISTVIDTLGRVITFHYDENNLLTAVTAPGLYGGTRTLVRLHYRQHALGYAFAGLTPRVRHATVWVVDAIYYPATGTGYWFGDADSYSSYGMIRKVSEQRRMGFSGPDPAPPEQGPTGQGTISPGPVSRQMVYDYTPGPDGGLTDAPTYQTMTETWEGMDSGPAVTRYEVRQFETPRRVEVEQPDGTRSVQLSYNSPGQFNDGLVYQDETYDAAERLLSKSTVAWEQGQYESPRPVRTEVTDELGQTSATEFSYETGLYNQVTEVRNFDYGGTTLLRKTRTEYENGPSYVNYPHIFNLVKAVEVYAADGTRESRTEYEYDGQSLQNAPGVVQHDPRYNPHAPWEEQCYWEPDQNDPDCTGGYEDGYCRQVYNCYPYNPYNPATAYRGNVTQVKTYADAASLGGAISETRRYDITGNLVVAATSCCEQTGFTYTTNTQYAYPESQTRGAADASDFNARVSTAANYNFNTGLVESTRDANGRTVTNGYHPETLRPENAYDNQTEAQTVTAYDDAGQTVTEATYTADRGVAEVNYKSLNGRGQVRYEGALGANGVWDAVVTKYDVFGRVWQQSRPHRDGYEQPRWSETSYDALGRVRSVRAPDGSLAQNFYNERARPPVASGAPGQTMRMVDAWGRERWGRTDAQNRLVEVVEPLRSGSAAIVSSARTMRHGSEALGQVTTYQYNTLGDLVGVAQGPQTRRFRYDSLGRLTHQKLAEAGATLNDDGVYVGAGSWGDVMSYDDRSNLISRTDARGVRTVFDYQNDPLNRLQSVSYDLSGFGDTAHPVEPAAPVTYQYRQRPGESVDVDVTQVSQVAATDVSREEYGYDFIGRVIEKTTTLTSRAAYPMQTNYVYDSLDRVTDVRYPAQYVREGIVPERKLVHHDYDAASRVSRVQVDGADYASSLDYNAASQTTSLSVGSGANQVGERYDYDPLTGLLTGQRVERGGTRLLDLTYDYVRAGTSGGRTGQLTRTTDHLDRNKDRGYQYDNLGRLRRVIAGQQSHWAQAYDYDRFGNRTRVLLTVGTEQYARDFFAAALGREPSAAEAGEWAGRLRQAFESGAQGQQWGAVLQEVRALGGAVFNSGEYAARGRTDEEFVTDLYCAFLRREPEPEGLADWLEVVAARGRQAAVALFGGDELELVASSLVPTERVSPAYVPRDGRDAVSYDYPSNRISLPGWEYDAAGNQTRVQRADGGWQRIRYDAAGRMVRVTSDDGQSEWQRVTYGHDNARLVREEAGVRTSYCWSGGAVISEYTEGGRQTEPRWSKNYIYLGARLLATQTSAGGAAERVEYHHPDRLGTRLVTNASDAGHYEQAALPYGVGLDSESTGATNRRFTSYDRSAATGLDYAVNRSYDPLQGRFTQVDPIEVGAVDLADPQNWNMYTYCGNDPVNYTDPSGLFFGKLFKAIGKVFKWVGIALAVATAVVLSTIIFAPAASFVFKAALWTLTNVLLPISQMPVIGGLIPVGTFGITSPWNPQSGGAFGNSWQGSQDDIITVAASCPKNYPAPGPNASQCPGAPWYKRLWDRAVGIDRWLGKNFAPDIFNDPWGGVEAASILVPGGSWVRLGKFGGGKAIALGHDLYVKSLARQTGSHYFKEWAAAGITRRTIDRHFGRAFNQAAKRADTIHFALDGIADVGQAVRLGSRGFVKGNFTRAELYSIFKNPNLLNKTQFYLGGKPIPRPSF